SKRRMTGQQLVKHRGKSINISDAADGRVITYRLFWGHVAGRTQHFHRARDSALCLDQSRKTKIGEVRFALSIKQNVSRFDVSMQDVVLVSVMNSARHFGD